MLYRNIFWFFISFFIATSCINNVTAQGLIEQDLTIDTITTTGFSVFWKNSLEVNSYLKYGFTRELELGVLNAGVTTSPIVTLSSASPSRLFYVQAVSELGNNIHLGDTIALMTQSTSSGTIHVYFNQSVDTSYALPNNTANFVGQGLADSLIAYINRAEESIDATFYNSTNSSAVADIAGALNNAHNRGVKVRVIYNENSSNTAIANLSSEIPRLESPPHDFDNNVGIMHHKFFVFDADIPLKSFVWTGSTNMTTQQINTDANHAIIIQDQSIARTYRMEFNEMWGSTESSPNLTHSRFGKDKIDDTPHLFYVAGKRMEVYFSPSDGVQDHLITRMKEATESLYINTMLITQNDIASVIIDLASNGVNVGVLVNTMQQTPVFNDLKQVLHGRLAEYSSQTGTLHHKTMLGEVENESRAFVFTGSHNWSASANRINDENTLVIYDQVIVNQFEQEFMARYLPIVSTLTAVDDSIYLSSTSIELIPVVENDNFYFTVEPYVEVIVPPQHGQANGSVFGLVSYLKDEEYSGLDSLCYRLCNIGIYDFCDTAWVYIFNEDILNIESNTHSNNLNESVFNVYPNPTSGELILSTQNSIGKPVVFYTQEGKIAYKHTVSNDLEKINLKEQGLSSGVYLIVLEGFEYNLKRKIILK